MSIIYNFLGQIAHNVSAVDEGFYDAIRKCVAFCTIKTLGGVERGRRSRPSGTKLREPLGPKRPQTCYAKLGLTVIDKRTILKYNNSKEHTMKTIESTLKKITDILPENIGISQGYIVDIHNQKSKLMDIVIYEKDYCTEKESFPCEHVIAAAITRDLIDADKINELYEDIESVKILNRNSKKEFVP
jgi:hypothetical protein